MICQNCQTEVADDLIFCTECGARLHETFSSEKTVVLPKTEVTKVVEKKNGSPLKMITVIAGIIALIAVGGVMILIFFNPFAKKTNTQNTGPKPTVKPTTKPSNQNKNVNISTNNSSNANTSNSDSPNQNSSPNVAEDPFAKKETTILDERINIDPNADMAFPFKVSSANAKIIGKVDLLNGENLEGFVFLQNIYDEHGADPNFKMFSFAAGAVEQTLPKGDYVLIFTNNDEKGVTVKANFKLVNN